MGANEAGGMQSSAEDVVLGPEPASATWATGLAYFVDGFRKFLGL